MKSILDKTFQYTPAAQTDLKETFRRVRKEQEEKARLEAEQRLDKVIRMRRGNGSR
jgi:hypothetical protein